MPTNGLASRCSGILTTVTAGTTLGAHGTTKTDIKRQSPHSSKCLKLDPKNVKAEDNLGLSYAALGHTEDAIAAYRQAMAWQEHELKKEPGPFIDFGILLWTRTVSQRQ